ncbi:hypothetical protein Vadar_006540 [Vaccinium darrowii]|uniref:Uncharacterized protein n=1 Tax=Vaccinium darrowii TaxID=229202 RepID=A0ACB7XG87_9ERIC|nr:hypothetical protein Vadar_006540 [Vaccinium darrowii]
MDEDNDLEYCDFPVDGGMIEERERERGRGKGRRKGNVGPPTPTDWDKVKLYMSFLKVFYVATLKFSGSLYVTCNAFFDEMVLIQQAIKKLCATNDSILYPLARECNVRILYILEKRSEFWLSGFSHDRSMAFWIHSRILVKILKNATIVGAFELTILLVLTSN